MSITKQENLFLSNIYIYIFSFLSTLKTLLIDPFLSVAIIEINYASFFSLCPTGTDDKIYRTQHLRLHNTKVVVNAH